jgi:glycosyl transferase family 2
MTSSGDRPSGVDPALPRWGLAATVKAPAADILAFAAYHLDMGAHRLHLFLDEPNPQTLVHLKAHPKIRVTTCDESYWKRINKRRPVKHQVRQSLNATFAYHHKAEVDWLIHMDVDEFLWSDVQIDVALAALPACVQSARIRPIEAMAGDGTAFKAFIPANKNRDATVTRLYPTYGDYVKGGFLSHVQGKVFVRTGVPDMELRIHSVFQNGDRDVDQTELADIDLCHCHAPSWDRWMDTFQYRLEKGSYRPDLSPAKPRAQGGVTLHELLSQILNEEGINGLRAFYQEVCADTPVLRQRLESEGLLKIRNLDLGTKIRKHFSNF